MKNNHANQNQNNERLEDGFIEKEEEERLEKIVSQMKGQGKTRGQICNFLKSRAEYYLKVMDKYCSEVDCDKYRREE